MDEIKAIDINNWPTQIKGLNYDYNKYQEWQQMAQTTFKPFFPTGRFPFTEEEQAELFLVHIDVHVYDKHNLGKMVELNLVAASLGGGFTNTAELKPLKLPEALAGPDKEK